MSAILSSIEMKTAILKLEKCPRTYPYEANQRCNGNKTILKNHHDTFMICYLSEEAQIPLQNSQIQSSTQHTPPVFDNKECIERNAQLMRLQYI